MANYELESVDLSVNIAGDASITANVADAQPLSVTLGKAAELNVGQATTYIQSGKVELQPLVNAAAQSASDAAADADRAEAAAASIYEMANKDLSNLTATGEARFDAKQDVISDLSTIRSGAAAGATAVQSVVTGSSNGTIKVDGTAVAVYGLGSAAYTSTSAYDASGAASTAETNAKNYADGLASNYATAAQGTKADTAIQPNDNVSDLINDAGYITGITSGDVTTALGYTPYDASNPSGYTSNVGTVTSVNSVSPVNGNVTLSIPTVNNSTITLTQGGTTKGTFTLNQATGTTIDFDAGGGGGGSYTAGTNISIINSEISTSAAKVTFRDWSA